VTAFKKILIIIYKGTHDRKIIRNLVADIFVISEEVLGDLGRV
jgi:hypothetical protein